MHHTYNGYLTFHKIFDNKDIDNAIESFYFSTIYLQESDEMHRIVWIVFQKLNLLSTFNINMWKFYNFLNYIYKKYNNF